MNRMLGATALGLALATGGIMAAHASVPLPVIEQASGMPTLAPVLKKITPAVVSIAVKGRAPEAQQRKGRDARHVEPAADHQVRAAGSGVVIDARQGLIITNHHVIDRADEITVTLSDGRELQAKLIGGDADTDVAIIKIAAENLTASMAFADFENELPDCAIRFGHGQWPDLHCEPLMDDSLLIVAAPAFNGGDLAVTPEQLMSLPLLHASESWPVWLSAAGCEHLRPRAALEFTDSSMMLEAARLGYGIALTRRSIAHAMIERRQLVQLTDIEAPHPSRYFLVWPVRSHQSPKLLLLLAWLKQQVADYQNSLMAVRKQRARKK